MTEFQKFVGNAIVILAGWWIVHLLSKKRDLQKSRGELVVKSSEKLDELATALLSTAQNYHRKDRDVLLEREIKMNLQDIAQRISALERILEDRSVRSECSTYVRGMRQSITGKHFEDEHAGPLAADHVLFQEILDSVARFKRGLLNLRYKQYEIGGR